MTTFLVFLVAGLVSGGVYAMAAMGIVFTYQVSRVVNLAYGGIAMFCAFTYWQMRVDWGWPAIIALPIAVLVLPTILALLSERYVYRGLASASLFAKTAASVGILLAFFGLSQYIWESPLQNQTLVPPALFPEHTFRLPGVVVNSNQVGVIGATTVIVIVLFLFLRLTPSGVAMRAVVGNRSLAELRGIDTQRTTKLTWVVSYVLAAAAGCLLAPFTGGNPLTLTLVVVYALAGAAVGRMVSLPWAVIGGLLLGIGDAMMLAYMPSGQFLSQLRLALPFVALLGALVIFSKNLSRVTVGESRTALMADLGHAALARRPHVREMLVRLIPVLIVIAIFQSLGNNYALTLISSGIAYGVIFLGYRILTATTGLVSLAQASVAGVGAFAGAGLITSWHLPWGVAVLGAGVAAGIAGAVVALPTVRLRGIFLVIATLAFAQLVTSVVFNINTFTGGLSGKNFPRPAGFDSPLSYLLLLLGLFVVIALLCEVFQYSVMGRELLADLGSPLGATSIGLSRTWGRLVAFIVSSAVAGVGGALLSSQIQVVSSGSWELVPLAFLWLMLVASGGLGSSAMMMQMGILVSVFPAIINAFVPTLNNSSIAIFGVLGLLILRVPGGAVGLEMRQARFVRGVVARLRTRGKGQAPQVELGNHSSSPERDSVSVGATRL